MIVRYRYRADPTAAQAEMLARTFGCARVVFNDALRLRDAAHETSILAAGQADRLNACRGGAGPGSVLAVAGEAGTRRGAG